MIFSKIVQFGILIKILSWSQLILKGHFFFNSPKKQAKEFCPSSLGQNLSFKVRFLGELETPKRYFEIKWPLVLWLQLKSTSDTNFFVIKFKKYLGIKVWGWSFCFIEDISNLDFSISIFNPEFFILNFHYEMFRVAEFIV